MSNNLTILTKKVGATWISTQFLKGEQTYRSERFFCVCTSVPTCYGRVLDSGAVFGWASSPFTGSANPKVLNPATLISKLALRQGGSKIKRSHIMAQLRLLVDDRLSVYAKRVRNAIKYHLPVFGDSPRILLDEQEISRLAKISIEKVRHAIKELMREGYLAPFFHGRKSKSSVYALQNPALSGDVMEVWA